MSKKLDIFFGSETGNAETLAGEISDELTDAGVENEVTDLSDYTVDQLSSVENALIVISTWGEGEPPPMVEEFYYDLEDGKAGDLPDLNYTIVALGDTSYDEFCGCGRKVDKHLETAGAKSFFRTRTLELDTFYEDEVAEWMETRIILSLSLAIPSYSEQLDSRCKSHLSFDHLPVFFPT